MNLTTALQILSDPQVTLELRVDDYWQQLLGQAVQRQLSETCFLMYKDAERVLDSNLITLDDEVPPQKFFDQLYAKSYDHCGCVEFWYSIPAAERKYKFYCLGAPSWCSSCGAQVNSVVFAKEGKLVKNACPACGVVREDTRLARDDWWQALAHGTGEIIASLQRATSGVLTQLIQKLAHFYVRGRIIVAADSKAGRNVATTELFGTLHEQFGDSQRTTCYEAARWAVWQETIQAATGLHLEDVAFTLRAAMMSVLIQACDEPDLIDKIKETLDEEIPYEKKMRAMRNLAHRDISEREPELRAKSLRIVYAADEFLVVKIAGNLDGIRSHLNIIGDIELKIEDDLRAHEIFDYLETGKDE
jgi:hypothetical protein